MEKNIIVIAKDNTKDVFYSKRFKDEKEAVKYGEQTVRQYKGYVIDYIEEKKTGHRWDIDVFEYTKEGTILSTLVVSSKKSAKLVVESLKEYDDGLRIHTCKIY